MNEVEDAFTLIEAQSDEIRRAVGVLIEDALETGEDRPAPEVADKLDRYIRREKYFQEMRQRAMKLKGE